MADGITRAMIDQAVLANDAAALDALIREAGDLKALLAGYPSNHPLRHAKSPDVAALLLPFAGKEQIKEAIWAALCWDPARPAVLRVLVEQGRDKLGTAFHEGHVLVDERMWARTSALHTAAQRGGVAALRCLLELNPYLELEDAEGRTALACAVASREVEAAALLLAAGADPNAGVAELRPDECYRPLAHLLFAGGARTTRAVGAFFTLLPSASWDRVIAQAAPARHWRRNDVEAVFKCIDVARARALLAAGADRGAAQTGALRNPEPRLLALLTPDAREFAPAALPALVADPRRLVAALRAGLEPDAQDASGCTLLTAAARQLAYAPTHATRRALSRSIRYLVRAGADRTGRRGRSSPIREFLSVAGLPHVEQLRFLLRLGLRDPRAIHFLCRDRWPAATAFLPQLLASGHDPNLPDARGRTPLHLLAVQEPSADMAELAILLLQAGADSTVMDPQGRTALEIAVAGKRTQLADCLTAEARRRQAETLASLGTVSQAAPRKRAPSL